MGTLDPTIQHSNANALALQIRPLIPEFIRTDCLVIDAAQLFGINTIFAGSFHHRRIMGNPAHASQLGNLGKLAGGDLSHKSIDQG